MIEIISTLATSVLSGGATGLLGVVISKFFEHKQKQSDIALLKLNLESGERMAAQEHAHQERMVDKQAQLAEMQESYRAQIAADQEAGANLRANYASDKATYSTDMTGKDSGWFARAVRALATLLLSLVDVTRGIVRPAVTLYSLYLLSHVLFWVQSLYARQGVITTTAEIKELATQSLATVFYLVTAVTTFWFTARANPPASRKQ